MRGKAVGRRKCGVVDPHNMYTEVHQSHLGGCVSLGSVARGGLKAVFTQLFIEKYALLSDSRLSRSLHFVKKVSNLAI